MGKLFQLMKPELPSIGAALVALVISSANNMNTPRVIGKIIDVAVKKEAGQGKLSSLASRAMMVFCVGAMASWARVYLFHTAKGRISSRLRRRVYDHVLHSPTEVADTAQAAQLTQILSEDINTTASIVSTDIARCLRSISSTVGSSVMLVRISPQLTVVSLAILPLVGASMMIFAKFVKRRRQRHDEMVTQAVSTADERVSQFHTVRLNAMEESELQRFEQSINSAERINRSLASAEGALMGAIALSASSSIVVVMLMGGELVQRGRLTSGQLTSFAFYSGLLSLGMAGLSSVGSELTKSLISSRRVFKLLEETPRLSLTDGEAPATCNGEIRFENVNFSYKARGGVEVLKDFSLNIPSGSVIGIVGASGSGKSTVAAALARLYDVTSGSITVDGKDILGLQPTWLRRHVCVVEQQPALFSGTIAENIRYANPSASDADMKRAARIANVDGFVESLPEGYGTMVGQRGVLLSGGQLQRIAIARAILRRPDVLVLDESTSNLDADNESAILHAILDEMKGRTVVIIAHRPRMVELADTVAVVDKGSVVQQGKFADLMADTNGLLSQLMQGKTASAEL